MSICLDMPYEELLRHVYHQDRAYALLHVDHPLPPDSFTLGIDRGEEPSRGVVTMHDIRTSEVRIVGTVADMPEPQVSEETMRRVRERVERHRDSLERMIFSAPLTMPCGSYQMAAIRALVGESPPAGENSRENPPLGEANPSLPVYSPR